MAPRKTDSHPVKRATVDKRPADFPRLIASTTYSHDSGTLTVGVERPTDNLSAMFTRAQDRLSTVGL